jgi:hypothetical protein
VGHIFDLWNIFIICDFSLICMSRLFNDVLNSLFQVMSKYLCCFLDLVLIDLDVGNIFDSMSNLVNVLVNIILILDDEFLCLLEDEFLCLI